jgi:beta-lactamase superfamily II metal-dependent hydrolase
MAIKKKTNVKKKGTATAPNSRQVTIRMYNVGFGDAFLVLVPDGNQQRRILFDCGSIEAVPGVTMSHVVDRIVRDVTDADGVPRIDVVVATHRHKDHVSGFGQAAWDGVEVREVWMPWTEHPTDAEARRIRDSQSRLALTLNIALTTKATALSEVQKEEMSRYQDLVSNVLLLSNDKAMKTLHSGFSGNPPRYFLPEKTGRNRTFETDVLPVELMPNARGEPRRRNRTFETDVLPGVKVHILGPSRERDVIRDMNPPKGESFLRLHGVVSEQAGAPPAPFPHEFRQASRMVGEPVSQQDLEEIRRAGSLSELAVAVALDKAVNGTSLMLILEVAGTYLLFPGDAQWGTWNAALEDPEWRELLTRVSFYKIGHHGSHNATPKDFVEALIPAGMCAMASTLTREIWPDIPRLPLLERLVAKEAHVARSDKVDEVGKVFRVDQGVIEAHIEL